VELTAVIGGLFAMKLQQIKPYGGQCDLYLVCRGIHKQANRTDKGWQRSYDTGCLGEADVAWTFVIEHQADSITAAGYRSERILDTGEATNFDSGAQLKILRIKGVAYPKACLVSASE
jgi:hypothetical protein